MKLWCYIMLFVLFITFLYVTISVGMIQLVIGLTRNPCLNGCVP